MRKPFNVISPETHIIDAVFQFAKNSRQYVFPGCKRWYMYWSFNNNGHCEQVFKGLRKWNLKSFSPLSCLLVLFFVVAFDIVNRAYAALLGAGLLLAFSVIPAPAAFSKINLNVIAILISMMTLVNTIKETGGISVCRHQGRKAGPRQSIEDHAFPVCCNCGDFFNARQCDDHFWSLRPSPSSSRWNSASHRFRLSSPNPLPRISAAPRQH